MSEDPALKPESREEYLNSEKEYFGNIGDNSYKPKGAGSISASDAAIADRHLPSMEEQFKLEQYYENGYSKTARSGAFSKAGAGPGIFPNGLKSAMTFIDKECTPGVHKPAEARPVLKEQTRKVDVPPAAVTVTHMCIDCLKPVDENDAGNIVPSLFIIADKDYERHQRMNVSFGDICLFVEHVACMKAAEQMGANKKRLVLIQEGKLTDTKDVAIALKYNLPLRLHDGRELTMGQFELAKRKERINDQFIDFLTHVSKDSSIYRKNREKQE